MKSKIIPIILFIPFSLVFFISCEDTTYREYKGNAPVYMTYEELRNAVVPEENIPLENPGKIYFKDDYIFIIEELKGIHVYDNHDPSSPVEKSFVKVPGVVDMVIAGNFLYADSFVDLVVLDVSDAENIKETGRIKDILPYTVPPVDNDFPMGYIDKKKGLVVEWELKIIKERVYENPDVYPFFKLAANAASSDGAYYSSSGSSTGVSSGGVGIGGSMARFGVKDDVLYLLESNRLNILDISVKSEPAKLFEINAGSGIETMFLTKNNMFLGTRTGMIIYDITNPWSLIKKSTYTHLRSCDPVVVDDTLAYVTLRSGTNCGGTINCLDVINIKNLSAPSLVRSYPMTNPYGLGKGGDLLFICDGNSGLKIYDASDPKTISSHLLFTYTAINAYDVIPVGNVLVLIGDDGLYQYDYSNVQNISLLSSIMVIPQE
jgi:hypothetical protein